MPSPIYVFLYKILPSKIVDIKMIQSSRYSIVSNHSLLSIKSLLLNQWIGLCIPLVLWFAACSETDTVQEEKRKVSLALEQYDRGFELQLKKDSEGAEAAYKKSLEISPRPITHLGLAQLLYSQGKLEEADKHLDQALWLSPNLNIAKEFKQRISIKRKVGAASSAPVGSQLESSVGQTVELEPRPQNFTQNSIDATQSEIKQGTLDVLEETIQPQLVDTQPTAETNRADKLYQDGFSYFQQKNYEEAEKAFRSAIEINPNHAKSLNDLGITLEYLGRSLEAVNIYKRAVETGNSQDAFFNLALLEEKRGEYQEAISLYEKYLQRDQTSAYADFAKERIRKLRRIAY